MTEVLENTQKNQIKKLSKSKQKRLLKLYQKRMTAMQNEHYRNPSEGVSLVDTKGLHSKTLGENLGFRLSTTTLVKEAISKRDSVRQLGTQKLHIRIAKKSLHEYSKPRYSVLNKFKASASLYDTCVKTPKGF